MGGAEEAAAKVAKYAAENPVVTTTVALAVGMAVGAQLETGSVGHQFACGAKGLVTAIGGQNAVDGLNQTGAALGFKLVPTECPQINTECAGYMKIIEKALNHSDKSSDSDSSQGPSTAGGSTSTPSAPSTSGSSTATPKSPNKTA